ncbi:hypothetical protein WJX72_004337 [[Myrmecia] bisecta]|uniref:MRPL25 domain-containing protein n=1 Tax=[Myrmecia] bisecta TaxID=41462 RepID=A0AAW1P3G9_9CHLO
MAHLLLRLGEAALKPIKVGEVWHKAAISGRIAARLRKQALLEGREWPFEPATVQPKVPKRPKGHKHNKLKLLRVKEIEEKLEAMPKRVAEYRKLATERDKGSSLVDLLTLLPKERRIKARGA